MDSNDLLISDIKSDPTIIKDLPNESQGYYKKALLKRVFIETVLIIGVVVIISLIIQLGVNKLFGIKTSWESRSTAIIGSFVAVAFTHIAFKLLCEYNVYCDNIKIKKTVNAIL
jgi:hypothetical protein